MTGPVEVLEGGTTRPGRAHRLVVALGVVVVLVCGGLWVRDRAAERHLRQTVALTTTFGVASSSTSPPGGAVRFFVVVRNDGPRPVAVTSVDASSRGLRVRMLDAADPRIGPGREVEIPLSARLTCAGRVAGTGADLPAAIGVRREDGGSATRRVALAPAALVLDVAATLCAVRPDLRDHELSGPVLRTG